MTNDKTLDARTRELIAGNCLPCLRHHFTEAIKAGCSLEEIHKGVQLSKMVKRRPINDIDRLASDLIERERQGTTRT
jgi:hypothetical protein